MNINTNSSDSASADRISIAFPLRGEWQFLRPPGHHPFAFDFVQMDPKRRKYSRKSRIRATLGPIGAEQFFCWDQPVYAPVRGEMIRVGTGAADHRRISLWRSAMLWYNATYRFRPKEIDGRLDIRPNAGNHVMIRTAAGDIVFLAHLRNGTVQVREGDRVEAGQEIGRLGNSGNSTMPHLHINLFDQMDDPYKAKVLPFVFDQYKELSGSGKWQNHTHSVPKVKSFIRLK